MTRSTILAYHAVGACPRADDPHRLWTPRHVFERQMQYLARARRVVPLAAVVADRVGAGKPAVALTFDDGYRCVLEEAVPILERHGFPATVFVPSAHIGDRNRWDAPSACALHIMTDDELREVERRGVDVESHGHRHLDLSGVGFEEAQTDVALSLARLETVTGRRPRFVAYPFHTGSTEARRAVASLGLDAAFTIDLPHDGPFAWARVSVAPDDGPRLFALKTSGRWAAIRWNPVLSSGYRLARRLRRR